MKETSLTFSLRPRAPLLILLLAALFVPIAARADQVDDFVRRQIHKRHIPGLSLAVVQDGRVIKAAGYGFANVELRARATPSTVYELASMSKQFAAASILLLVQDGKVSLDAPISRYLEGTPDSWKAITVRRVLTHTSGLPREGIQTTDKNGRADFTREEMWKSAIAMPLIAPPGERFSYSNLGYNLLAMIVEKVSGKPYGEFLQQRIFGPLGMRSSRLNDLHAIIPNRACGYSWSQGKLRIGEATSPTLYFGAGAIVSTVLDLAKWDAALYTDRILNAESRKEMATAVALNNGRTAAYGFGWFVGSLEGHPRISHDGLLSGFRTYITRFLNDHLTLIILTNQSSLNDPGTVANGVAREYLPGLTDYLTAAPGGQESGSTLDQPPPRLNQSALAALTGRYEYSNNLMLTVEAAKGRLLAHLPGSENDVYTPLSDTVFVCDEEATRLTFVKAADGGVSEIEVQEYDSKRKIPRIGPLASSLVPTADPDPARTAKILVLLKAIAEGGKAVQDAQGLAPGARTDFASAEADLAGLQSIAYLGERDETGRKLTRHGGAIARVLYFQWKTAAANRYIQVYLTPEGLVTDEDVVDS
jgi:CubicO group peptidase (beta-lactamase class C family)